MEYDTIKVIMKSAYAINQGLGLRKEGKGFFFDERRERVLNGFCGDWKRKRRCVLQSEFVSEMKK